VVVVLVLQVWCCVVKLGLVTMVVIMNYSNFSCRPTINIFSILCLEHHYCGDQQWRLHLLIIVTQQLQHYS